MTDRFILVVDDDPEMASCIADALSTPQRRCETVSSGAAALAACRQGEVDVVVTDVRMAGMDGFELMSRLQHQHADLPVILMTGDGSVSAAVEATKRGAFHYLLKPFDVAELGRVVDQAAQKRRGVRGAGHQMPSGTEELLGDSEPMAELRARIELVAAASAPLLIVGETGTGKELVARAIHACSPRRAQPFVTVNAAAIPEPLLESEMFGHVRGAFTGAMQSHRGLFAEADGGTMLLDEIGDMPAALQAKLLRVLQAGEIRSVGSVRSQHVDVRVIAATHRKLPDLVREGRFREDLYYRLNVINISVPPLRVRAADVRQLAEAFFARARSKAPHAIVSSMSEDLLAVLAQATWPGNVRELQSVVERLVVLARDAVLEPRHLTLVEDVITLPGRATPLPLPFPEGEPATIELLVRRHVEAVLSHTEGNKARAAKILGIDLSTLYRWQQRWQSGVRAGSP